MQIDPVQEWQRLAEAYREKNEGELLELSRDFGDLTEMAQQALRAEFHSRGLGDPEAPKVAEAAPEESDRSQPRGPIGEPLKGIAGQPAGGGFSFISVMPSPIPDAPIGGEDGASRDYTWKTELCVLSNSQEAAQLREALRRAGIECWFRFDGAVVTYVPSSTYRFGNGDIQVLVAADQLDEARVIAEKPIPQEIIEDLRTEAPDYATPKCPKCRAEDPTLESVEPTNHWLCETCGAEWDDPEAPAEADGNEV